MALQQQAGVSPQALDHGERSHEDGENDREVAALEALAGCADSGYLDIVDGLDGRHPRDTCFALHGDSSKQSALRQWIEDRYDYERHSSGIAECILRSFTVGDEPVPTEIAPAHLPLTL